jgi:hypothetical protein
LEKKGTPNSRDILISIFNLYLKPTFFLSPITSYLPSLHHVEKSEERGFLRWFTGKLLYIFKTPEGTNCREGLKKTFFPRVDVMNT